jgi:putative YhbY family RNA-binding protein
MIELSTEQRRALRADAHHLNPVVTVAGKGLAESVLREIDRSLMAHELIKVKLQGVEREDKAALLAAICAELHCAPVQQIGNTLILWRPKPEEAAETPARRSKGKPLTKKQAALVGEGMPIAKASKPKAPRRRTTSTATEPRRTANERRTTPAKPASPRTPRRRSS